MEEMWNTLIHPCNVRKFYWFAPENLYLVPGFTTYVVVAFDTLHMLSAESVNVTRPRTVGALLGRRMDGRHDSDSGSNFTAAARITTP